MIEALDEARALGFLGPGPVADHVQHALGFARAWGGAPPGALVDLGSGGGVPGLVLAGCWPSSTVFLLDANERRVAFLERVAARLDLGGVRVVPGRAEAVGRDPAMRGRFDAVTARGFGPPAVTAECGAPFLRVGGRLVVSDPPEGAQRWPAEPLAELGLLPLRQVRAPAAYAVLVQSAPCPERFPRRIGIPTKRPLF